MIIDYKTAYFILAAAMWIVAIIQIVPVIYDKCKENKKKREEKREKKLAKEEEIKGYQDRIAELEKQVIGLNAQLEETTKKKPHKKKNTEQS